MYDITRKSSFLSLESFIEEIRQYADDSCVSYLVGNKYDLVEKSEKNRKVSTQMAEEFANKYNLKFFETSTYSNYNVSKVFEELLYGK